jgi:eukaryotic-like serine/threonine-protein kinase
MRPPYALIATLLVPAALLAGCGGGGEDSTESAPTTTTATTALTKAELIEQGDAICAEVNAAVGTVGASSAETSSPSAQAADLYSGMVASLKNLGAPQEAAGYSEFTGAADELATTEGEVKLASERGDTAGLEAAESKASAALASFQEAAQEYGFKQCGEGPSAPTAPEAGGTGSAEAPEESEVEAVEPEAEAEPAPEVTPETCGAGGATEGGGTTGGGSGGGTTGGESGGIGPG